MINRSNVEEEIMNCWQVVDELRMLSQDDRIPREQMAAILRGLSELYALKFDKLLFTFERMGSLVEYSSRKPQPQQADLFAQDVENRRTLFDDNMNRGSNGTWTI